MLSKATDRSQPLLTEDLVAFVERSHTHEGPGVSRERLRTYATALADEPSFEFDPDAFLDTVDERLVDAESWAGDDALYRVDGRVSTYPEHWHAELGGATDVASYVAFLEDEVVGRESETSHGGSGEGIPEQQLLDAVAMIGQLTHDDAKAALADGRANGEVVEGPDQHPDAGVTLADDRADDR